MSEKNDDKTPHIYDLKATGAVKESYILGIQWEQ